MSLPPIREHHTLDITAPPPAYEISPRPPTSCDPFIPPSAPARISELYPPRRRCKSEPDLRAPSFSAEGGRYETMLRINSEILRVYREQLAGCDNLVQEHVIKFGKRLRTFLNGELVLSNKRCTGCNGEYELLKSSPFCRNCRP